MRAIPRLELSHTGGLVDKVVGLGKEIYGELFDEPRLIQAGTAQQGKGTEKLEALRTEAKADSHRRKARGAARAQRDVQVTKAS